jgi:hypothetical protein
VWRRITFYAQDKEVLQIWMAEEQALMLQRELERSRENS